MKPSSRGVFLMCLVSFLQGMVFYAPVAALYRTQAGVSLGQIALIESISWLVSLALEIPWGLVTARIGYRASLMACCGVYFVSKLVFWQADSFGDFLTERLLLSLVTAGLSGCDSAYLYLCAGKNAHRALGFYEALGMAGLLTASAVFALFVGDAYRLAALLTVGSYGLAALAALALPGVPAPPRQTALRQLGCLAAQLKAKPRFALFIVAGALLAESAQFVTVFLSQLLYAEKGFGPTALTGAYLACTAVGLCAGASHAVTARLGARTLGRVCFWSAGCVCAVLSFGPSAPLAVACVLALRAAADVYRPWELARQNACALRWGPPSVLVSGYSMLAGLVSSGMNAGLSRASDVSLSAACAACAGACVLAALLFEAGFSAQSTESKENPS